MPNSPIFPRTIKGGLVLIDPATSAVRRIIILQYNPESLSRSLAPQTVGESGGHASATRYKGPPVETIQIEAEVDATDRLEQPGHFGSGEALTVLPILSALEGILYPNSSQLSANERLAQSGTLNIIPLESALVLFVWSKNRIIPVRLTNLSVVEEAFDTQLNPIRARVHIEMRVLSVSDLGFGHKGGTLYMVYQQKKEELAQMLENGNFNMLGIGGIP
jgi:hypothetical protein